MRRTLGALALLLATLPSLGGCGDDTSAQSPPAGAPAVTLVSATAGGGDVETRATDVTDDADLAAYVEQLDDSLATKVTEAAGDVHGDVVLAQVVSIGCDVPPSAEVQGDVIVPAEVAKPMKECLAPVTTVAVAGVSD
jgi:hypothetical protein